MVWVPGGDFAMGDTVYPEEGPIGIVHVGGFWMDRHDVTNREFEQFVSASGYVTEAERAVSAAAHPGLPAEMRKPGAMVFVMPRSLAGMTDIAQWWHYVVGADRLHPAGPGSSIAGREDFPVVEVTYSDAIAYARWKGRELPTEAEWEWAARGADPNAKPGRGQPASANTWQGTFPVYDRGDDGFVGLAPVGCYAPNRLGLYDMIGNVWQWTASEYTPDHSAAEAYEPDRGGAAKPAAQEVRFYTIKGGSYLCAPNYCMRYRPGARQPQEADLAASHLGFRTILHPAPRNSITTHNSTANMEAQR
jgi:formylglycine-generating enzyme